MDLAEPIDRDLDDEDSLPLRELHRLAGGRCHGCGVGYEPHDAVFSIAMGFKTTPRCLACLAKGFDRPTEAFRTELIEYVHRRECYLRAWREADRMSQKHTTTTTTVTERSPSPVLPSQSTEEWDVGDLGCGDLVLALRVRLKALPNGAVLTVRATDPAAPEDLPSWCRLTGHTMIEAKHPSYTIRRK